ncbi:hypothetical protein KY284_020317 [Solanum tuberosum]|nr:hypothetical protein KY284_020317 [Solanum tuberosum]
MGFWEPSTVTFKFLDFEITPTLEEFNSLTELPIKGRLSVIPSTICTGDFLSLLDLHIFRSLRYVDGRHVELDYIFQRFGRSESYYEYQREFEYTRGAWEHMRPRVFIMVFLGVMVFPIRSNSIDINILPMVISIFNDPQRFTLVPMILAEVLRSLTVCIRGHDFFRGCNILLQIWARKNFYRLDQQMDYYIAAPNKIESHEYRLQNWMGAPTGREEWRTFLNNLTGDAIQWKFSWFGVIQGIPLWSIMGSHEDTFTSVSLERIRNMQTEWESIIDFRNRRRKLVYARVLRLAEYHESYGSSKRTRTLRIVPRSVDYLIQEEDLEEDLEKDPEEDPEEDLEEDPEEDPEEYPEEDLKENPEE